MSFWLYENKNPIFANTINLAARDSSNVLIPPIITTSNVMCENLHAEFATNSTQPNATGPITIVSGITSITAQTGSGTTFAMQDSPILNTPNLGVASGTCLNLTGQLTSTIPTGYPPLVVTSTTKVDNLHVATTSALESATTTIDVSSATAPTVGQVLTATSNVTAIWANAAAGGATIELDNLGTTAVNADILPDTNNTWDLGSAAAKWAEVHATTFTGALTGTADVATQVAITAPVTGFYSVLAGPSGAGNGGVSTCAISLQMNMATRSLTLQEGDLHLAVNGGGGHIYCRATTNQVSMGDLGGNYTTISSTAPAANRTVTLHDGGGNSNFVLDTGGALTITNSATTSQVLTATGTNTATWQAAAGGGGSVAADSITGTTTATAAGTTTLVSTDDIVQIFTGATTQTVKFPVTTGKLGMTFSIINMSTGTVTVQDTSANAVDSLLTVSSGTYRCVGVAGVAADWKKTASG